MSQGEEMVIQNYKDIRKELELFSDLLKNKEEVIVFSKADVIPPDEIIALSKKLAKHFKTKKYFTISAAGFQ